VPTWLIIVLILLVVLAVGGALARRRQLAASEDRFRAELTQADHDLAAARAEDRGWDRERLERLALDAFGERNPGATCDEVALVQVVDRPGTDEDKAIFELTAQGRSHRVVLGRERGEWVAES
jgi:hypothetical protein